MHASAAFLISILKEFLCHTWAVHLLGYGQRSREVYMYTWVAFFFFFFFGYTRSEPLCKGDFGVVVTYRFLCIIWIDILIQF